MRIQTFESHPTKEDCKHHQPFFLQIKFNTILVESTLKLKVLPCLLCTTSFRCAATLAKLQGWLYTQEEEGSFAGWWLWRNSTWVGVRGLHSTCKGNYVYMEPAPALVNSYDLFIEFNIFSFTNTRVQRLLSRKRVK